MSAQPHDIYPPQPTAIPDSIIVAGAELFDIAVELLKLEKRLMENLGNCDSPESDAAGQLFCAVYQLGFGEMFRDWDESLPALDSPADESPLYVLAQAKAAA